ncbi:hypothetical protein Shyhy02_08950 [Streptomyces hygroscopicus subsp. hygroscopicus]|nr:hypothetical protein Shyhy02_08950 [Streptomyces hygroscopicus subsp. hygroscopicus]
MPGGGASASARAGESGALRYASASWLSPRRGSARSCSFTDFSTAPQPPPGTVSATGYCVVNQPTVRDRSTAPSSSSRPWPSMATSTRSSPVQSASTRPSALMSTSLICVRYAPGTRRSSPSVTSRSSRTRTVRVVPAVAVPGRSTGRAAPPARHTPSQYARSPSIRPSFTWPASRWAQVVKGVGTGSSRTGSPAAACR